MKKTDEPVLLPVSASRVWWAIRLLLLLLLVQPIWAESSRVGPVQYPAEYELKRPLEKLLSRLREYLGDRSFSGVECRIIVHKEPNARVNSDTAYTILKGTHYGPESLLDATVRVLAPEGYESDALDRLDLPKSRPEYFHLVVSHEVAGVFLVRATQVKAQGWRAEQAPPWFLQGLEEYLALETVEPYLRRVSLDGDHVAEIDDPYLEGAVMIAYLVDVRGLEGVFSLLSDPSPTFDQALERKLQLSQDEVYNLCKRWLEERE